MENNGSGQLKGPTTCLWALLFIAFTLMVIGVVMADIMVKLP